MLQPFGVFPSYSGNLNHFWRMCCHNLNLHWNPHQVLSDLFSTVCASSTLINLSDGCLHNGHSVSCSNDFPSFSSSNMYPHTVHLNIAIPISPIFIDREISVISRSICNLVVFFSYFKKALWMCTYRAYLWCFFTDYQMSAVSAFPHNLFALFKYFLHLYVI